jgi:hypothetical protein
MVVDNGIRIVWKYTFPVFKPSESIAVYDRDLERRLMDEFIGPCAIAKGP